MMTKDYGTEALAAVHETAQGLHEAGVMAKRTLKEFDALCSIPAEVRTGHGVVCPKPIPCHGEEA